jgi:subtilisin family serine protease
VNLDQDGAVVAVPAEAPHVVAVSATGPVGFNHGAPGLEQPVNTPAPYSNHGAGVVNLSAPGGNFDPARPTGWQYDLVLSSASNPRFDADGDYVGAAHSYNWIAGTSMASPQVAGAAALVASAEPQLRPTQVAAVLRRTADDAPGGRTYHGSGYLDTLGAVQLLRGHRNREDGEDDDDDGRGRGHGRSEDDDEDGRRGWR